jgi:deoxyribodipyrimidine photo-lyase
MNGLAETIDVSIVWLRRDLRLYDNVALYEASRSSKRVCVAFASIRSCSKATVWDRRWYAPSSMWRDFFQMILRYFPHVADSSFDPKAEQISWHDPDGQFTAWSEGCTGYPIVDAGMRQLNSTGWMNPLSKDHQRPQGN